MPPRSLIGTLFAAAAALWGLLIGVLITLLAKGAPSLGFWLGTVLLAGSGFGWGVAVRPMLTRRLSGSHRPAGLVRFAVMGVVVVLLAGVTALVAGGVLTALTSGVGAVWGALRRVLERPAAFAWPVAGVVLIGVPFGAAAGVVLHVMAAPGEEDSHAANGSPYRSSR